MKALLVANPNAGRIGGEAGSVRLAQRLREAGPWQVAMQHP